MEGLESIGLLTWLLEAKVFETIFLVKTCSSFVKTWFSISKEFGKELETNKILITTE